MISINNLTVSYGGFTLLDNISFHISESDKIGLVGKNGAGKSTVMKLICGLQSPTSGHIDMPNHIHVGYLPQIMEHHRGRSVMDETMTAFEAMFALEAELEEINKELCSSNPEGMFVTAFIGILDLKSGRIKYINAGHCPPLHKTANGYDYVDMNRNIVLGAMDGYKCESRELVLQNHERLFLYTDGVTEAQNKKHEMYGEERLKEILNHKEVSLSDTLTYIHKDIARFVKKAPQSDDITMLAIEFHKNK